MFFKVAFAAGLIMAAVLAVVVVIDEDDIDPDEAPSSSSEEPGPSGDQENPLGPAVAPPSSTEPPEEGATSTTRPSTPPASACYAREPRTDALCLIGVTIEVSGLGAGGVYVWDAAGFGPAGGRRDPSANFIIGSQGECTFLTPNVEEFLLTTLISEDGPPPIDLFNDVAFSAGVRISQTDYVSIGYDEHFGVTTGGLSAGGPADGSRGGEQWPIEGGAVTFTTPTVLRHSEAVPGEDRDGFTIGRFTASWSGTSIENYSGEEATGNVSVNCDFWFKRSD